MNITEILLLILGAVICVAGFVIPEIYKGKPTDPSAAKAQEKIRQAADESVADAKKRIADIVSTESGIAQDETERAMEKITNEKIMAINDYGKTVVDDIEKNHKEVMFLYDMLNSKSADIKNTVRKVDSVTRTEKLETADREIPKKTEIPKKPAAQVKIPKAFTPAADKKETSAYGAINEKIVEMHDAGSDDIEIAKALGIGVGEVRLKIGLVEAGRNNEA